MIAASSAFRRRVQAFTLVTAWIAAMVAARSAAPAANARVAGPRPLDARAMELFRAAGARGAAVVCDAGTGDAVVSVGIGHDVAARVLPLSTIKLYTAALWWAHGLGDGAFSDPRHGRLTLHDALVLGYDRPAELAAVELRRRLGGRAVLEQLRGYGLTGLTLAPDAGDLAWGRTLSIGEGEVTVTPREVAEFLRTTPARALDADLRAAVTRGSAASVATRLDGTGWRLGGKTGTGPNVVGPTSDGWFAGVIFEGDVPRYTFAVFVEHHGPGGAAAASIAADLAAILARRASSPP